MPQHSSFNSNSLWKWARIMDATARTVDRKQNIFMWWWLWWVCCLCWFLLWLMSTMFMLKASYTKPIWARLYMSAFLQSAAPIHLGFSLHMFLHFFIMNRRLSQFRYNWRQTQLGSQCGVNQPSIQTLESSTEIVVQAKEEQRPLISRPLSAITQGD